jgi:hypothetical protein
METAVQPPKEVKTQTSSNKVFAPLFWDRGGILHIDYLGEGTTIAQSILVHFSTY